MLSESKAKKSSQAKLDNKCISQEKTYFKSTIHLVYKIQNHVISSRSIHLLLELL